VLDDVRAGGVRRCPGGGGSRSGQSAHQAPEPRRVHRDYHDEQRQGDQEVYGFQHLDDHIGRTAIEVVDVEDDAPHPATLAFQYVGERL
jgi:hypothetical protein